MKRFGSEIHAAVKSGKLVRPFSAVLVKQACPSLADGTYKTFLGKHAVGNGNATELFERKERGLYRLKESNRRSL